MCLLDSLDLACLQYTDASTGLHTVPEVILRLHSNQQLGTYDPRNNNGEANCITATWGSKDLKDKMVKDQWGAREAYVMSVMNINGEITISGDDAYNLGIARFEVPTFEIFKSKLASLQLPPP